MDAQADFDVNEAIKSYDSDPAAIATPDAPRELQDFEHEPERLGEEGATINAELNVVVDAVAGSPEAITRSSHFDTLQFLLKFSSQIPAATLGKILDLVGSALSVQADVTHADIQAGDQDALKQHKTLLEMYGFLFRWTVSAVESREPQEKTGASAAGGRGRAKGAKPKAKKDGTWDASAQLEAALDRISKVLRLDLGRIFVTTSERDTFIGLLTKPVYHIMENSETTGRLKSAAIKAHCFRVLGQAVKNHGHAYNAQISITQALFFYSHLSEAMADLLHLIAENYAYPQLAEEVLREISEKQFSDSDRRGPTSVSAFLMRISELLPEIVMKQIVTLANLLDKESYNLRMAMIDVCGNMIIHLSKQTQSEGEENEESKARMNTFFDELEQRFRDINPYCRARVMQVYIKLCDLPQRLSKRRKTAAKYAAYSLKDKSSNVRRNAIKLLTKLVETHRFRNPEDQGVLSKKRAEQQIEKYESEINALIPPETAATGEQTALDETMQHEPTQVEFGVTADSQPQHPDDMTEEQKIALLKKLELKAAMDTLSKKQKYYVEMLKFIEVVDDAAEDVMQLLSAKNKSEVIEAMDFFVKMSAYKIPNANSGIRRMLRLIWTKGNSDEGKGVQTHLIECYRDLFFVADPSLDRDMADNYITSNMISLTFGTTPAELTSLEQLLSTMMKQGMIRETIIQKLWTTYGAKSISRTMRRGAIIILGMLALAKPAIIVEEMELCLRIGLGGLGRRDFSLARYTCIALRRISGAPGGKQSEPGAPTQAAKLPNDHAVLVKLAGICEIVSDDKEWFGVAEQAISAIYVLSKHPDVLCSEILRRKTKHVFAPQAPSRPTSSGSGAGDPMEVDVPEVPVEETPQPRKQNPALALSQLLFIVGHVAIKQIVHLELCELEFKRRKAEKQLKAAPTSRKSLAAETAAPAKKGRKKSTNKEQTPAPEVDELELMAGPSEDDITDHITAIREHELLYGANSLLTNFGPLVRDICLNQASYNHPTLQAQAALCLAKLMCVSSEYCDKNLELFLNMMTRSNDPVVRSNLVIALADMAVCFNQLIDENESFLYGRLNDADPSVKRTCLMSLTFLILAGQVKVKSELAKMAKCMEDSDDKIKDMARMFFTELATKDNAIYNQFIDMFSTLSGDTHLGEDAFKKIIRTLSGYVEKDKHAKVLAKKLAERLPRANTEKEWNDIAFTLGQLQHKDEDITKKVAEGFQVVQASA